MSVRLAGESDLGGVIGWLLGCSETLLESWLVEPAADPTAAREALVTWRVHTALDLGAVFVATSGQPLGGRLQRWNRDFNKKFRRGEIPRVPARQSAGMVYPADMDMPCQRRLHTLFQATVVVTPPGGVAQATVGLGSATIPEELWTAWFDHVRPLTTIVVTAQGDNSEMLESAGFEIAARYSNPKSDLPAIVSWTHP